MNCERCGNGSAHFELDHPTLGKRNICGACLRSLAEWWAKVKAFS
jgi:hypothetical protein